MFRAPKMFLFLSALALNSVACIWVPDYELDQNEQRLILDAGDEATIFLEFSNDSNDYPGDVGIWLKADPIFERSPLPDTEDCEGCLSEEPSGDLAPQHMTLELSHGDALVKRWELEEEDFELDGNEALRYIDDEGQTVDRQPWNYFSWQAGGDGVLTGEGQTDGYIELDYTFNGEPRTLVTEFVLNVDDNGNYLIEIVGEMIFVVASIPFVFFGNGNSFQ